MVVGGGAAEFLEPLGFIHAFGAETGEEGCAGFLFAGALVDGFDQALINGVGQGDTVMGPGGGENFRFKIGDFRRGGRGGGLGAFDLRKDMVKKAVGATVGGDDFELAAPGGDGLGDAVEQGLVLVKSKFIEDDMAALASEGVGIGGEGMDGAAVGEMEDPGGIALVGQKEGAVGRRGEGRGT